MGVIIGVVVGIALIVTIIYIIWSKCFCYVPSVIYAMGDSYFDFNQYIHID